MAVASHLKHKALASLRELTVETRPPKPLPKPASEASLGRWIVREEMDPEEGRVIARVIGVPSERLRALGVLLKEALGIVVLMEGRDLLVMGCPGERLMALLRDAGAAETVFVPRAVPASPGDAGAGGTDRSLIRRGLRVAVVLKADQESGSLTEGVVRDILTRSPTHPRGIKVRLESGEVGRVRRILSG